MNENITWSGFFEIIKSRMREPKQNPGFGLYFILIVVIVGGLGFWINVFNFDLSMLKKSLATYFIAILATSAVDISLHDFEKEKDYKKAFQLSAYLVLTLGVIVVFFVESITLLIIYTLVSWSVWWFANADNSIILGPPPKLNKATGENQPIRGDLDNVKY